MAKLCHQENIMQPTCRLGKAAGAVAVDLVGGFIQQQGLARAAEGGQRLGPLQLEVPEQRARNFGCNSRVGDFTSLELVG